MSSKTVSVSEAKNQLSAIMEWAIENPEGVIIESRGRPKVAILSYAEYQEFLALREQARRKEAFQRMEELAETIRARNADLTPDEAEELADEISRDAIQRMIDKGKVVFQS